MSPGRCRTDAQNMRITTIVLGYRRAILIAVYTHLLRELPRLGSFN